MDRTSLLFLWRYYTMTSTNCNRKIFPELEPMERKLVINSKDQWKEGSLMKKLWLLLLLVLLTGCGAPGTQLQLPEGVFTSAEEIYAVDRAETYPEAPGEPAEIYDSLEALTEAADEIVLGCAKSVEKNGSEITTDFLTTESWKGSLREGLSFTVREEKGIAPMEPEETYVLFLQGEYPEYRLCGAVQGRFVEHRGYLFQQTWGSLKLPDAPARTASLANAVSRLQPMPTCGPYGPPWIWSFENVYAVKDFIKAAEGAETCTRWIEENGAIHGGLLHDTEQAASIAAALKQLPFPAIAEDLCLPVDVYPGYGRDYVETVHRDGEKLCWITIYMEAETVEAGTYGRPVEAENFQVLFDQTDVLLQEKTNWHYVGQAGGYRISFSLRNYEQEEALQFLRELQFEPLGEGC